MSYKPSICPGILGVRPVSPNSTEVTFRCLHQRILDLPVEKITQNFLHHNNFLNCPQCEQQQRNIETPPDTPPAGIFSTLAKKVRKALKK